MTVTTRGTGDGRVSKSDIEGKLRELRGDVDSTATAAKPMILAAAAVAVVGTLAVVYLLGRRQGKRKNTIVEVRRF